MRKEFTPMVLQAMGNDRKRINSPAIRRYKRFRLLLFMLFLHLTALLAEYIDKPYENFDTLSNSNVATRLPKKM
jgi:hypothetical protein